ncbi:branched-chain amino acid ABC transporter permease [Synergistales bacterium]|nr:branched-chain amino acid ABC transporter permease [Synergistales bacterium]
MSLNMFIQHFINALGLGALYGLIAVGYTMVYGILRLINFAHGDIFMLGAYFVFFATIQYKLPWGVGVVIAIAGATIVGLLVDRIAYRPLRSAPRISALISAIGVSFFLENLAVVVFTGMPRAVVQPDWLMQPIPLGQLGAIRLIPLALMVPIVSFVLIGGLLWIVYKTKPGLAMRSISHDIETTRLMGVSVDRIIALTFALGSALAALAGIMWALRYPRVEPFMGIFPGFKAFIAAVFGGIGSIPGAMIGGLTLGFVEIMSIAFFPNMSGYKDAFAFILLIVILLVKPTGLMGEKMEEKI